ncbi:CHAT domain-containing protein [Actinoplanes sp. NPDC049548]|uniref:CHAT domain-containing protein n=1 Tax=Actinoplanes sp. NPDC049548 TaxID=3155152 RepID=UPI00343541DA
MSRLIPLLRGLLDGARCPSCVAPVGVASSIVVVLASRGAVAFVVGELLRDRRDELLSRNWAAVLPGVAAPQLVEVPDADTLRRIVVGVLHERLAPLIEFARAVTDGASDGFLSERWRAFTPELFAAARLAAADEFPELGFGLPGAGPVDHPTMAALVTPDRFRESDRIAALTLLQASVLVALCEEWTRLISPGSTPPDGVTFEGDLATYVDRGPTFDHLAAALLIFEESYRSEFAGRLSPYVLEAVRASIHVHMEEPNPQAQHWAFLFFAHELAVGRAEDAAGVISAQRAGATVGYDEAWHALTGWLSEITSAEHGDAFPPDAVELLGEIAGKAGYPHLLRAVTQFNVRSPVDTVEGVLDMLQGLGTVEALTGAARAHAEFLVAQGRFDGLETIAATMLERVGDDADGRAKVEAWLAGAVNRAQQPRRVLARIGDSPSDWEGRAGDQARISLWHERSIALEASGRAVDALAVRREIMRLLPESSDRYPWALANLGLSHLQMGRPDLALPIFEEVERRIGADPLLLTYQAAARQALGDAEGAEERRQRAGRLAAPDDVARHSVQRAATLMYEGQHQAAIELLLAHGLAGRAVSPRNGWHLLDEAKCWTMLLQHHVRLPASGRSRLAEVAVMLGRLAQQAKAAGHAAMHAATVQAQAALVDAVRMPRPVGARWANAYAVRQGYGMPPDATTLIKLAFDRYLHRDAPAGRRYLCQVPTAVSASVAEMTDLSLVVRGPGHLADPLGHLATLLMGGPGTDVQDLRLVAELQRDATGRVGIQRRVPHLEPFRHGVSDRVLRRLTPEKGGLVVIEWFHCRSWTAADETSLGCLLTRIGSNGRVATRLLPPIDVEPSGVAVRVRTRLYNWGPRRRGDPLDEPDWRRLAEWLVAALRQHAAPGDHVVIIGNRWTAGLPWHAAVGPAWSVSYAPGWTALIDLISQPPPPRTRIGVLAVPRIGERPEVAGGLRATAAHATRLGIPAFAPPEASCDRAAFNRVMRECDIAVLLCHGYTSDTEQEVALMLANHGDLPLAGAVATGSSDGIGHRLSWRDCTRLEHASRTVFSAACSSGVSYHAGLGDRLGLFGTLRHAGTTAIVAPGWDGVAEAVLPILDDTLSRFAAGEPLGAALRSACLAGRNTQPPWLAWALTLEGDWR